MLLKIVELNEKNQIEYKQKLITFLKKKKNFGFFLQILQSINTEESPLNSTIDSELNEDENDDEHIKIVEQSIPTSETDEVILFFQFLFENK